MLAQNRIWIGLAALFAGALVPFSFAPFNLLILSYIGIAVFAWLILLPQNRKSLFINALLFGFGLFAVGVSWVYVSIHDYGEAMPALAVLMTFAFVLFLAAIFATPWLLLSFLPNKPIAQILCFAALWLLGEWLRGWFLTGFPWLYLGQGHLNSTLSGWMPILGSLGIGFVQAAICATLALSIQYRAKPICIRIAAAIALFIFIASPLLNRIDWTAPMQPVEVTLVQPNISLIDKWNAELRDANLQRLLDLSEGHWNTDILVWPEAALPLTHLGNDQLLSEISEYLGPETSLLTGRLVYDSISRRFYNNVIGLGNGSGEYSKRRLVPFGEYVPLENQLRGLINFFDLPMSMISSGDSVQDQLKAGQLSIAIALCYEIAYGHQVAIDSRTANLLTTVSNDTWFGDSIGPHQHFQLAQVRAKETGKPVLRGTNDGISGLIDQRGRVIIQTDQFVATSVTAEVTPYSGKTPFSYWGQTPMTILAMFTLLIFAGLDWQKRRQFSGEV